MRHWSGLSIKSKLALLVALAAGSALVVACSAMAVNDYWTLREATVQRLTAIGDVLGANTIAPLTFEQPAPAEEALASLRFEPIVECACVFDDRGQVFATYRRDGAKPFEFAIPAGAPEHWHEFANDGRLHIVSEIRDDEGLVGRLFIRASMDHLKAHLGKNLRTSLLVLAVAMMGSFTVSSVFQRRISNPILSLARTADAISQDRDYSVRVTGASGDELGSLYDSFNRMLDEIEAGEEQLRLAHEQLEARVIARTQELAKANADLACQVAERRRAEEDLRALQHRHIAAARQAGMAEIATNVLHNVGNVLNSVNISAALIADHLRRLRIADLCRATDLLRQHAHDLPDYIGADERGRHLPAFLIELGRHMAHEEERLAQEARSLAKYVEHIKGIVAVQQSYAGISGVVETASLAELLDDAIRINQASMERHGVEVAREFDNLPPALVDRQKFLQIVVNLVSNAYHAVRQAGVKPGRIHVRMRRTEDDSVRIDVIDNGVGISPENLTRVFAHGFTTRKDGHGFGLHSSALYAQDMGGRLTAKSAGCGCGAEFTLELPLRGAGLSPCKPTDEPLTTLSSPIAAS